MEYNAELLDDDSKKINFSDIKRLSGYAWKFKSDFIKAIVFLIISVGFGLLSPFIAKNIFDTKLAQEVLNIYEIVALTILFLISSLAGLGFNYLGSIQLQKVAVSVVRDMRAELFDTVQGQEISFFDNMPAGKTVSKITNDTSAVGDLYVTVFSEFLTSFVHLAGVIIALLVIDPYFALVCFLILLIFFAIVKFYTNYATKHNHVIRDKLSELNAMVNESIQGMAVVQSFNAQDKILNEFDNVIEERVNSQKKLLALESALSHNIMNFLKGFSMTVMAAFFGYQVVKANTVVTIGIIYVYMEYLSIIFRQTNGLLDKMPKLQKSIVASKHIFELMDREKMPIKNDKIEKIVGDVEFKDVSFAYKDDEYVLKNINFYAKAGQTIGLVGHTGSGKSSIMNLLMKFYQAQKGEILIDGKNIADVSPKAIREYMGIVLQEPYLFAGTILSNINLGNPKITKEKAIEALDMLGGKIVTQNLANGIDEKVLERGNTLSAGQRQLISFARALAHDPRILILDEATSSIDSETELVIQEAMKVLMKGRTTFVIAHRLSTIRNADKIILLDKGEIVEEGTHDELISLKGKYFEMYEAQSRAKTKVTKC